MDESKLSFNGSSFFEKQATLENPRVLWNALKIFRRIPEEKENSLGKFVLKPTDSTVPAENLHLFNQDDVLNATKKESKEHGTGSFLADALLGLTKKISPITREPIENAVFKGKQNLEDIDTKAGKFLAGENPHSFRGKLFSTKVTRQVGEVKDNGEGPPSKILREDRRPSFLAPVSNATKVVTPILAASYVGEKMYPPNHQQGYTAPYEPEIDKQSSEIEGKGIFDNSLMEQMDKLASMQKIAELEEHLAATETKLENLAMEKLATEKKLEQTVREKESIEKRANDAEENLLEKQAEFEELRLRTIAQKRSKVAVDLAEQLLEHGIIKQASLEPTIDKLMDCDESTIKMYQNMVNDSKKQDESLESLAFLREYRTNDKLAATSSKEAATSGLSKRGQSIGDAARDLNKK